MVRGLMGAAVLAAMFTATAQAGLIGRAIAPAADDHIDYVDTSMAFAGHGAGAPIYGDPHADCGCGGAEHACCDDAWGGYCAKNPFAGLKLPRLHHDCCDRWAPHRLYSRYRDQFGPCGGCRNELLVKAKHRLHCAKHRMLHAKHRLSKVGDRLHGLLHRDCCDCGQDACDACRGGIYGEPTYAAPMYGEPVYDGGIYGPAPGDIEMHESAPSIIAPEAAPAGDPPPELEGTSFRSAGFGLLERITDR